MRRILVARLDSLGDVLLAGPAVRAVAADGAVTFLCSSRGAPAARLLPGVSRILEWDCPWILADEPPVDAGEISRLLAAVRDIDEAVLLTSFHQSPLPMALLLRLAGVARIVGASVDHAGSLLDVRLRPGEDLDEDQPEAERALAIAAAAGHHLPAGDDGRLAVRSGAVAGGAPYVVVHPGADAPARTWPGRRHGALVRLLRSAGWRVLVTGSAQETALTAAVAGMDATDLGGRLSLEELAGVLRGARAVVVGNTGPAHLAAAVGTPVVSLFAPVVPARRWAPSGVACEVLGDQEAPCRDSRARICPVPGHPCLSDVTPQQVLAAVTRLAGHAPAPTPKERS